MMRGAASNRELPKSIGRYEVVRQLGAGAMGRVLLARDPVLERHVAIKILRDDLDIASDVREALIVRMRHEARAAARVTHPNLVVLHDMGQDETLGLYLVFEWLEGPTLQQRLAEGRLSARQAARMAKELGSALTFAHERGVLHRDVKPENIILSVTGTKLTDFGIARIPDSTLTHAGGLLGTPAYSGPETFREGRFSPESDQFSLAATLYEAIRGERAFPGEDAVSVASKIASDSPAAFAEDMRYPPELDAILAKGMAKAPAARFESCRALGIAVMDALLRQAPAARATATPHEASGDRPSETTTSLALARLSSLPNPPPAPLHERKPLQVLLGGILTILIAGLLVRAMLKKSTTEAAEVPTAAITARVTSAEPTAKPRPRIPVAPQRPRPVLTASTSEPVPSSSADPSPPSSAAPTLPASSVVPVPTPPPP